MADFVFATAIYESGDWESAPLLPANLIDSIARYTALPVAPKGVNVALGTRQVFEYPLLWLTGHLPVRFTDQERRNLQLYVQRGGMMIVDDHNHDIDGIFHKTAWEEIERTFGTGSLKELPGNHELYFCFFKFDDGPPATSHELNGWGDNLMHRYLHAVTINGRIGLLYSSKDYSSEWNFNPSTKQFMSVDPTRFGVNVVVYALSR
ncbi:MAG: DUF4159 domain-containing protein [Gemmatimonadaceae bacterium]|nr:DUF4159 domain-containing protein [Gemmatimonadaceae bacterium]